ncbi:aspartic proteinase nepenthesin-1-like [Pyrus ussuriensis x Pyrus communis]|uniref:Aspartic proteinase nepenthesin-1-like n=1 Tax=Pyrus ussuriensis x Pyrus communis TaxID=2448454 RepID=A0A5N5I5P7_9ROSA|nr:aspartic proteinase nepenthesin-1-like [Pyrus ussuriensis x Pyrus communis]
MKMEQNSTLFIIFLLSVIHGFVFVHALRGASPEKALKLKLIHRYSPHYNGLHGDEKPKNQQELLRLLHRHDVVRHQMISYRRQQQEEESLLDAEEVILNSSRIAARRMAWEKRGSMAMPISSGSDYGWGQYLVKIKIGTPAQKFLLVADTGSDLTWINCRYRCRNRCEKHQGRLQQKRVFHAELSSSFKTVPCSSKLCKVGLWTMYLDGTHAFGLFANETVWVSMASDRRTKLENVIVGCTDRTKGGGGTGSIRHGDGILGLGFGRNSFATKASLNFGGKFSYCLVDLQSPKNVSNFLTFGGHKSARLQKPMTYTKLVIGDSEDKGSFYGVNVQGISVGGKMLDIPPRVWDENLKGGTIVDSGTSLTFLKVPAYKAVMKVMTMALSKVKKLSPDNDPFDFCFSSKGFNKSLVPKFAIHFADGAIFEPPVKSYALDVADGKMCLGFVPTNVGPSVIGNIMQQNHLWEFDLGRRTLGFAPSTCT